LLFIRLYAIILVCGKYQGGAFMFYVLCLLLFAFGTYLYNYGFKQKSPVMKMGATVVMLGAVALIVLAAIYGRTVIKGCDRHHGPMGQEEHMPMCPMMEKMMEMKKGGEGCGCGGNANVEIQRPPITQDKYHQPMKKIIMTDPMESGKAPVKK